MMAREQIERIAANCGVEVSYTKHGKGGFIFELFKTTYKSVNDIFVGSFDTSASISERK